MDLEEYAVDEEGYVIVKFVSELHSENYNKLVYTDDKLNIDFYPSFLSIEEADELYNILFSSLFSEKPLTRRANFTFGDTKSDGSMISYTVQFKNNTVTRVATPWSIPLKKGQSPLLKIYKDRLEQLTGSRYNYVVVQYYPSGKVGINPHRDKEMRSGTDIAGVSLGATRDLVMIRNFKEQAIYLTHGSLYVLKPPTNDYWQHSIPKDDEIQGARISLTYRYTD